MLATNSCCRGADLKRLTPQDADDDVRAVAAEALLPVATQLATMRAASVTALQGQLWDILLDVDELSPSTGAAAIA